MGLPIIWHFKAQKETFMESGLYVSYNKVGDSNDKIHPIRLSHDPYPAAC